MDASQTPSSSALRALPIVGTADDELTLAIDTFLSQPDMAANTRRSYAATLRFIEREVGGQPTNAPLLAAIVTQRWDESSPATWNLRVASVGSFLTYVREQDLLDVPGELRLRRRREHHDNTRSLPIASLERLSPLAAPRNSDPRAHALANALRDGGARR